MKRRRKWPKRGQLESSPSLSTWEKIETFEGLVAMEWAVAEVHRQKVVKLKEVLKLSEAAPKAIKEKVEVVEARATMEKSKVVTEAKFQAME